MHGAQTAVSPGFRICRKESWAGSGSGFILVHAHTADQQVREFQGRRMQGDGTHGCPYLSGLDGQQALWAASGPQAGCRVPSGPAGSAGNTFSIQEPRHLGPGLRVLAVTPTSPA